MTTLTLPDFLPDCDIDAVDTDGIGLIVKAHTTGAASPCPYCGQRSHRIHSYYTRTISDLPISTYAVYLKLRIRRFRCFNTACPKKTFAERIPGLVAPYAQRTVRLVDSLHAVGYVLGGEAGRRLVDALRMRTSGDTLIRILRQKAPVLTVTPRVLGVDDWAFRKGRTYGTLLVDLERHKAIDLLPDRTATTLATWLRAHPGITIVARDRSTEYARGITEGAPEAQQVADRWHLLLNLRQMLERFVSRIYSTLKRLPVVAGSGNETKPGSERGAFPRTRGEELASQASHSRRLARYEEIQRLRQEGKSIRKIAATLKLHRATVRTFYYADEFPERSQRRRQPSILDPYLPYLESRQQEGCENALQLWREIQGQGYAGSHRQVSKWIQQRRTRSAPSTRKQYLDAIEPQQKPEQPQEVALASVKELAWLLLKDPDALTEPETNILARIRQHTNVDTLYPLAQGFVRMVRQRLPDMLDDWLRACASSNIAAVMTFAAGIQQDYAAVHAGLELDWSSGQTEGQINRLKLVKRQMYGRAGFDLLRLRVLNAA